MNESKQMGRTYSITGFDTTSGAFGPQTFTLKWADVRSGVDNPRYKSQISENVNATTAFSGTKSEIISDGDCSCDIKWHNTVQNQDHYANFSGYGGNRPYFNQNVVSLTSADNAAKGKFYSNARSAQTAFQGGVFLGELAETIHMIRHPASGLATVYKSALDAYANLAKRYAGRRLSRLQLQQALASVYLEYSFGIKPLVNDIADAAKAYERLRTQQRQLRVSGFGEESKSVSNVTGVETIMNAHMNFRFNEVATTVGQVRYYGSIKGSVSGAPPVSDALTQFGFNTSEFLPTLWELLPWSFLVDYFANIGDIVSATSYIDASLAWVSKTTRAVNVVRRSGSYSAKDSTLPLSWNPTGGGSYSWETRSTVIDRAPIGSVGVPTLELSIPGSSARWANMTALSLQSTRISSLLSRLVR